MLKNFTIKTRLLLLIGFMSLIIIALTGLNLVAMRQGNQSLKGVNDNMILPLADLGEIKTRSLHIRTALITSIALPAELPSQLDKVEHEIVVIKTLWDQYAATHWTADERILAGQFSADYQLFSDHVKTVLRQLRAAKSEDEKQQATTFYFKEVRGAYNPVTKDIEQLIQFQKQLVKQEFDAVENRYHQQLIISIIALMLGVSLSVLTGYLQVRSICRALQSAQQTAEAIAAGNLTTVIDNSRNDEIGALLTSMQTMQNALNNFVGALDLMAQKHNAGYVKEQIDDAQFAGSYHVMAHQVNELVQSRVAINRRIIEIVGHYAKGDFSVDMDSLPGESAIVTETMHNVKKAFVDVTDEIKMLASAGAKGDFSKRTHAERFEHQFKAILVDLNHLFETNDLGFNDLLRVADALSNGDLSQTIDKDYPGFLGHTKDNLNATVVNLRKLVAGIKEAADTINIAATEIASGNNDLSQRTEQQAASLEQTAASMQQLVATVQNNTDNATQGNRLAVNASAIANKGVDAVNHVVATMQDINQASSKIVDIISVIDNIAFQTNILALNAAVEAARAGEQGRGFAVVAMEVRNLAQRATAAAGEIKALISNSVERIEEGSQLAIHAGATMTEIVSSINNVTNIMKGISAASVEQTHGIEQVNQAIGQMDETTQQNAALVEQAAAAAESLEEQTRQLSKAVANFKLDGPG